MRPATGAATTPSAFSIKESGGTFRRLCGVRARAPTTAAFGLARVLPAPACSVCCVARRTRPGLCGLPGSSPAVVSRFGPADRAPTDWLRSSSAGPHARMTSAGQATCAPTAGPTGKPTSIPCPARPHATKTATERGTWETTSGRVQEKVHPQVPPRCSRPLSNRLARKARPPSHHQKKNNDLEGGRVFREERKGTAKAGRGLEGRRQEN